MTVHSCATGRRARLSWLWLLTLVLMLAPGPAVRASAFSDWLASLDPNANAEAERLKALFILACLFQLGPCAPPPCTDTPATPCPPTASGATTKVGHCVAITCSAQPRGGEQWFDDPGRLVCGKTEVLGPGPCDAQCVNTGCKWPPRAPSGKNAFGYDALPPDTVPATVAVIDPPPGGILFDDQPVRVRFTESMDALAVAFGGALGTQVAPDYAFARDVRFNDTLTVVPATRWPIGTRTLELDLKDDAGNPTHAAVSWYVLAAGTPAVPDFGDCRADLGAPCGERWFTPYGALFSAVGGVPPYTWSAGPGALPHDAGLFADSGLFAGGPRPGCGPAEGTACLLFPPSCLLYQHCLDPVGFEVCVTDRLGSQACHPVRWEFGL
jgi:hypothetical protein